MIRNALLKHTVTVLLGTVCSLTAPSALSADEAGHPAGIIAKVMSSRQCWAFGNARASFSGDADTPIVRIAYGSEDGIFGGAWFPVDSFQAAPAQASGIVLNLRGGGTRPGKAYLFLRNANGVGYRSKDLAGAFLRQQWYDLRLTADDFILDPENKGEAAKELPAKPDWASVERVYISAVNVEAEPALEIRSIRYEMSVVADAVAVDHLAADAAKRADLPPGVVATNRDAITPSAKKVDFASGTWWERHQRFVARAKEGNVDLLWLGDSITDNWNQYKATYRKLYPDVKAANFGIGGDGTQNLLWRLQNGELDGLSPKVAVVLIGTNNVQWHPSDQIISAIGQIVTTIRSKCPNTKVLVLGLFPRGDLAAGSVGQQRIGEVNAAIARLDDGKTVRYLDISSKLANPDGTILTAAYADKVHLSPKGFAVWAEAMRPLLDEMMKP